MHMALDLNAKLKAVEGAIFANDNLSIYSNVFRRSLSYPTRW